MEGRVERPVLDLQDLVGAARDGVRDGVAVGRPGLQRLQHEEIESSLKQVGVERGGRAARHGGSIREHRRDHKMI